MNHPEEFTKTTPNCIIKWVLKERQHIALITVVRGEMTSREIEMEFQNVLSTEHWRWSARKIVDNKFYMRFPNAKMVSDYNNFMLGKKNSEAQMLIEPWSSAVGAKGQLQQA